MASDRAGVPPHRRAGNAHRWTAAVVAVVLAGGCQIVSGLSGLHEGSGGASSASGGALSASGGSTVASSSSGCAHDCADAGCTAAGICGAYVLVPDPGAGSGHVPNSLASDGTYVYWSVLITGAVPGGFIHRQNIKAASGTDVVAMTIVPQKLVVGGDFVSWIDGGFVTPVIKTARSDGSTMGGTYTELSGQATNTLRAVGTSLVWNSANNANSLEFGVVPSLSQVNTLTFATPVTGFDMDAKRLFWSDSAGIYTHSLPLTGPNVSAQTPLFDPTNATQLVVDQVENGNVCWTTAKGVSWGPKNGKKPPGEWFSVPTQNVNQVLADASYIYWNDACTSTPAIHRVSVAGGAPVLIANPKTCGALAQDKASLYWIDQGNIYRWIK